MEGVKELIQFENLQVEIWRRAYQRSLNLRVRPDGLVRVTCGRGIARRAIERFVVESRDFIHKRQLEIERLRALHPEKKFLSGEMFLYLGEPRPLEVVWTWGTRVRVRWTGEQLEMLAPLASTEGERRKALHVFFKKSARPHLEARVQHYTALSGLRAERVSVRGQRSRWGSCTSGGTISLNWKLMAAPEWVIDYVVVHELAHTRHLDHSPRFWRLVEEFHPERRAATAWLRANEPALSRQFA